MTDLTVSDLREVTPPTAEPVSIELVKQHLRLGGDPEAADDHESLNLPLYITAARKHAERITGLILTDAVYELRVRELSPPIYFPVTPVAEVVSIHYVDVDGEVQELNPATYHFSASAWAPYVWRLSAATWPTHRGADEDSVVVRFRGPYGSTSESPPRVSLDDDIRLAILMMIGHWYENREEGAPAAVHEVPLAAMHILQLNRRNMGV